MNGHAVNVPALRKVLEHITAHQDEWDQDYWAAKSSRSSCGTSHCLAGHAVVFAGHKIAWSPASTTAHFLTTGEEIGDMAEQELGLTPEQGYHLFSDVNSLPDLWRIAGEYTNGEIVAPVDLGVTV